MGHAMSAIVSVLGCVCSLACGSVGDEDTVRVVTYNLRWDAPGDGPNRWRHRREAMLEYLRADPGELSALQELTPAQLQDVERGVEGGYTWSPLAHVAARTPRDAKVLREEVLDLPGGRYPRAAALVELALHGRRFTFAAVHLEGGQDGLHQVRALLEALEAWPRPWLLAGDFNAYAMPTSECLRRPERYHVLCNSAYDLLRSYGLVDPLVELHGVQAYSTATGFDPPEQRWRPDFDARIDWILATPGLEPVRAWIGDPSTAAGRPLSDHRPVHAAFRFGGAASLPRSSPAPAAPLR